MTPEAKVAAYVSGAVLDALWDRFRHTSRVLSADQLDGEYAEWKAVAVAAVEALPVSEREEVWTQEQPEDVLPVERVRAWHEALAVCGPADDYFVSEMFGKRLVFADVSALLAAVDRLTAERDDARDRAFKAAFCDEEGATREWAVQHPEGDVGFPVTGTNDLEKVARSVAVREGLVAVSRVIGPWKPVSP